MSAPTTTDDDERSELEQSIADGLAALSLAEYLPDALDGPTEPFEPHDVDFTTSAWMHRLADVQDWLHLPERLDDSTPARFVAGLAESVVPGADGGVTGGIDGPRLSTAALTALHHRCSQALTHQARFVEALEAAESSGAATRAWVAMWEEVDQEDDVDNGGPITAKTLVWPISEFAARAAARKLELSPSYQRDDVWPTGDSQLLIESILRGIPLPSVILLEPTNIRDSSYEVVDGKQRLTSILRFIGRHPSALDTVRQADHQFPDHHLAELFETDYPKFRRAWKAAVGESLTSTLERKYYFPFRLKPHSPAMTGDLAELSGKYYTQIKDLYVDIASTTEQVRTLFEMTSEYKIPVISYTQATPRQIHEVFNLYNKQGKHLNAEEIRNALFHRLDLMRGLLVAAGDSSARAGVAPFLDPVWNEVSKIAYQLEDMAFGTQRYRRTKVLSWLCSMVVLDSVEDGKPLRRSTASQTNALLERVENDRRDALRDAERLRELFLLLTAAVEAHSAASRAWAPWFMDGKSGTRWQELQLVATLMGVVAAGAVLGDGLSARLQTVADTIREETAGAALDPRSLWRRPAKTQTAEQVRFQSGIALRILDLLEVDPFVADAALRDRFGGSTVRAWTLVATR